MHHSIIVRHLGVQPYQNVHRAMESFTRVRDKSDLDELWLLEHLPVYTQGQAGKPEHIINPGNIPVIQTDRGGQVTYHAPGQWIVYCLIDLKRAGLGIRDMVSTIEQSVIECLSELGIESFARPDAPGVYVGGSSDQSLPLSAVPKISALGLRVRRGCSFHGLSLNVDMDLEPFQRINPCGYAGMSVTQVTTELKARGGWSSLQNSAAKSPPLGPDTMSIVAEKLVKQLVSQLGYNSPIDITSEYPKTLLAR